MTAPAAPAAADGRAPAGPPRRPRRFSALGARLTVALVAVAVLPLLLALPAARWLEEDNAGAWLAPRVATRLAAEPAIYGALFRARKELYAEQARALARGLSLDPRAARARLEVAIARVAHLRRAAVIGRDGATIAEVVAPPGPEDEQGWRAAPVRVRLAGGAELRCTFGVEAAFFAALDETRELAEVARGMEQTRAEVRRSILLAFGGLVALAAAVAALLGHLLSRRTVARLALLAEAHRRVAEGDLSVRLEPGRGRDEVDALARGFNVMVEDVRAARDRIVYLEKISSWQEVARRLAHEIKNPLTPIQLAFQQLQARWGAHPGGDPAFGALLGEVGAIVRGEIATLQRLVEEFSAFARLPDARPAPADLADFLDEFVRTSPQLAAEADVVRTPPPGPLPVAIDAELMRRVLANLAENAVQAARPARARLHLETGRSGDRAFLTVADEGPGVDAGLRERIFDPYFTTKETGTGLGLAIVKKIVLQQGGEIRVGDRPGGGAAFTITLPIAG